MDPRVIGGEMRDVLIRSKGWLRRAALFAAGATSMLMAAVAVADGAADPSTASDLHSAAIEEDALLESIGEGPSDPFERVNRISFWINRSIEIAVLDPVSQIYGMVVPDPAKRAVRRAFTNLNSAGVFANDVLQLEGEDAMATAMRFAINSTVGVVGFFDLATELGLAGHESDFGETLWRYGVGDGPYLFLPVLGPANARDAVGRVIDGLMRPQFYLLGPIERIAFDATDGLTLREGHLDGLRALRESALDYYSAFRSAYVMSRDAELRRRSEVSARSRSAIAHGKLGPIGFARER
jgi:phospholipid-binding lipoprotein MlaA